MSYAASEGGRERPSARAAIFVDYEDLFRTLSATTTRNGEVGALISEMIEALKRSLLEERETQTAVSQAYADFTELNGQGDALQRALYLQGVESRFVPQSLQANAVEIQLCVDAMELLHHRGDINMFVLLTGSRSYLPLIQHVKRYGHRVLIVALEEPPSLDHVPHVNGEWFFDARDLLSSSGLSVLTQRERASSTFRSEPAATRRTSFKTIDDPILIRGLEIIEEYFGQYEEVYLTPLLRKMSEVLDERSCDPKAIIGDLEDLHAVRLEKREGHPHDYTVLIVQRDHPDVERVRQDVSDRVPYYFDDVGSTYDEDYEVSVDGHPERVETESYASPSKHDDGIERDFRTDGVDADLDAYDLDDGDMHTSRPQQ